MKSINFEFLRSTWPHLAGLGGFAEAYAHSDPIGSLSKLRSFCEHATKFIHHHLRLPRLFRPNLIDLLNHPPFVHTVPEVVLAKMHSLRIEGNRAVHGNKGDTTTALRLLKDAYNVGRWLHINFANGKADDCPQFSEPPEGGAEGVERRREKRAVLERVTAQEAQMKKLLADLEAERERTQQAVATTEELQAALESGQQSVAQLATVSPLDFNEDQTRRHLIDVMLADARWDVAPQLQSTDQVAKEFKVEHQPTQSGIGYADYNLRDAGAKSLGVVEAKKTAKNAEDGRTQAQLYADGIEKMDGQRPAIFYTNGYDLWIWNDAEQEPPRKIYGYYSKDSLEHLHFRRKEREPVSAVAADPEIAGRMYQIEAVRRVVERFAEKKREALIVQATGTGKTRVAISLSSALIRAKWVKRILFLCDRRELRKQAFNAFKEFLPSEPRTYVTAHTAGDRNQRIYFATYPAMMRCYELFDVGFFDLIIADESHRSLYNRYRELFQYFDAYQVGLTATPVDFVSRNTFEMFKCEDGDPTFDYSYEQAVKDKFLVPPVVDTHTTQFLREGIQYAQLSPEQRRQLEEDGELPQAIQFEQAQVDKAVFNRDTNRHILRNLMDNGIRVADGTRLGKTIIFARNHNHAVLLQNLFDEMYPQYGGNFCRIIDSHDDRADELIDDFKGEGNNPDLTIAISVDMLDTGIDVPEIVNLVFAKPVYSFVKFWQMIGRGTRLCLNLFGPGKHKTHFQIFDHWGNFERFDQKFETPAPVPAKSLMQRVFETRLKLAKTALDCQNAEAFDLAIDQIAADIASLPEKTIAVREKWQTVQTIARKETLRQFDAATQATLANDIAPLMQWCNISGHQAAYKFDQLIAQLHIERLRQSSRVDDLKDDLKEQVSNLPINLNQVRDKLPVIDRVKADPFWDNLTVQSLEDIRRELRGIMKFERPGGPGPMPPKVLDIVEDDALVERNRHKVQLEGLDLAAYRNRVQKVLMDIIDQNATLQKIRSGQPVKEADLESLCSLVLTQDPTLDLRDLTEYYPEAAGQLDQAIRGIIGMDAAVVQERFTEFVQNHPYLASHQIKFLQLVQNHISKYGSVEIDRLYDPPFTDFDSDGLDGVFDDALAGEIIKIIDSFQQSA